MSLIGRVKRGYLYGTENRLLLQDTMRLVF
nr:MAG TPA: hypothetical protein [Caudoviricetes sp.]DAT69735.1 MAG TPA: hypothetical protein [Caudoviricetes sp.]